MSFLTDIFRNRYYRYLSITGFLLLEFFILYAAFIDNITERVEYAEQKEQALKREFQAKVEKSLALDELKKQLADARNINAHYLQLLPGKVRIDDVLMDFSKAAASNNVTLIDFQVEKETPKEFYSEVRVKVKLKGAFKNIMFALEDRVAYPSMQLSSIVDYTFSANTKDTVLFDGIMVLFRYIEEGDQNSEQNPMRK